MFHSTCPPRPYLFAHDSDACLFILFFFPWRRSLYLVFFSFRPSVGGMPFLFPLSLESCYPPTSRSFPLSLYRPDKSFFPFRAYQGSPILFFLTSVRPTSFFAILRLTILLASMSAFFFSPARHSHTSSPT